LCCRLICFDSRRSSSCCRPPDCMHNKAQPMRAPESSRQKSCQCVARQHAQHTHNPCQSGRAAADKTDITIPSKSQ
jgi:hypothetical protein